MALKKDKASKTLGAIKHNLKQAPKEGRFLAYTSLKSDIRRYQLHMMKSLETAKR